MPKTAVVRARIDSRRKARVEKILADLGLTSTQAINLFFAQIEHRKGIPFTISLAEGADFVPPIQQVAKVWNELDDEDFAHLASK